LGLPAGDEAVPLDQIEALVHPEDRERFLRRMRETLQPQETLEFEDEYRLLRPDGSIRWIRTRGRTFFAGSGKSRHPISATGIVMDITSIRATEAALAQRRAEFDALVESAIDAIISIDTLQRIVLFNPAASRMFRCPPQDAIGQPLGAFLSEDILEACREHLRQLAHDGVVLPLADQPRIFSARRADGDSFPVEATLAKVEVDGQWELMISIRDISERQKAEDMLRRLKTELACQLQERQPESGHSREALETSNLKLQQFAYIAAHDLQAPLRSIKGFALMLQGELQGRLGPQGDTWLNYLLRSTQRMQTLINDLLTYSQVDSHGKEFEPVDFSQIFDDVAITLDAAIRESGARITRDELPVVQGDRTQLGQLLQNLVSNAVKYSSQREPAAIAFGQARQPDGSTAFFVRDNGAGFDMAYSGKLFQLFQRLHSVAQFEGTGVGLTIVQRIIERHGGRVWAESRVDQGATFYFTLPEGQYEASPSG